MLASTAGYVVCIHSGASLGNEVSFVHSNQLETASGLGQTGSTPPSVLEPLCLDHAALTCTHLSTGPSVHLQGLGEAVDVGPRAPELALNPWLCVSLPMEAEASTG